MYKVKYRSPKNDFLWLTLVRAPDKYDIYETPGVKEPKFSTEGASSEVAGKFKHHFYGADRSSTGHVILLSKIYEDPSIRASQFLDLEREFAKAKDHFGDRLNGLAGVFLEDWHNMSDFNELTLPPRSLTPEEAIWETFQGKKAKELGFTQAVFSEETLAHFRSSAPGHYKGAYVRFSKPEAAK